MKTAKPRSRLIGVVGIAAALLALPACGGNSLGGSGAPADAFVGDWSFMSGSIMPMCPASLNVSDIPLQGNTATITKIDTSHVRVLIATADVMCNVMFSISGSTAANSAGVNRPNITATVQRDTSWWTDLRIFMISISPGFLISRRLPATKIERVRTTLRERR